MKFRNTSSREIGLYADRSISGALERNDRVSGNIWEFQEEDDILEVSEEDSPDSQNIVTMKDIKPSYT